MRVQQRTLMLFQRKNLPPFGVAAERPFVVVGSFFTRPCDINTDGPAFNDSTIQFFDRFLGSVLVRHFYKSETTAAIGKLVCNNFCRGNFSVLSKVFPQVFILYAEA